MNKAAPIDSFDEAVYQRIGYDELLTYAVSALENVGTEATFESTVAQCFRLFPVKFHLRGFPQWPDSSRVNKSWLRCRADKSYLVGSVKEGFALTKKGREAAMKVEETLNGRRPVAGVRRRRTELATREGNLLAELEKSPAFKRYSAGDRGPISEYDYRDALLCTMQTPRTVLISNLRQFEHAASMYDRTDILEFLHLLEASYLDADPLDPPAYKGGMMRKRAPTKRRS